MNKSRCKCYFCRKWVDTKDAPKIRVDPTEGPSEYTVGRVCSICTKLERHKSTDTKHRLNNSVEYPPKPEESEEEINAALMFLMSIEGTELDK